VKFSSQIWDQIKNKTASEIIRSLEKDAWHRDTTSGAEQVFRHPDGRRVSIHFHPSKTFGPKLPKGLLQDIGWTEEDMRRLKFIK
jgi:predicted RNA binding protein YcfA (HicA-like mRNA interferase family)